MNTLKTLSTDELKEVNGGGLLDLVFTNSSTDEDGSTSTSSFGLRVDSLFDFLFSDEIF